jgi:hypothetical protein
MELGSCRLGQGRRERACGGVKGQTGLGHQTGREKRVGFSFILFFLLF